MMILEDEKVLKEVVIKLVNKIPRDINLVSASAREMIINTIVEGIINYNEKNKPQIASIENKSLKFD